MADNQVTLELSVDSKDAQKAIEQFGASSIKSVKKVESSFKGLASSFSSLIAPLASVAVAMKAVGEANEAEKSMRSLSIAIASTGEYSKSALKALQGFSNELSDLTGIDDDVINSQLAVAKSFGITNDQAKNLVKAATNLSAVTGVDLESAVKQLGGTFDGTVGKIGNLGGGFRALTKEQLENGAAIDLINKNYQDAGATIGDTFEGDLNRVKNSFNDTFKAIGEEILNDPNLRGGLASLSKAIKDFAPIAVEMAKVVISAFKYVGTGIATIVSGITLGLSKLSGFVGLDKISKDLENFSFSAFDVVNSLNKQTEETEKASGATQRFEEQMTKLSNSYDKNSKNAEKNAKIVAELKKQYDEVVKSIQNAGLSELEAAGKLAGDRFATIDKAVKYGVVKESEASIQRLKVIEEFNKAYEKSAKEAAEKSAEAYRGSFDSVKSGLKELQKASDEYGKTQFEIIDLEQKRAEELAKNSSTELIILGKTSAQADEIIAKYIELSKVKADISKIDLAIKELDKMNIFAKTIGTITLNISKLLGISAETTAKLAIAVGNFFNTFKGFLSGSAKIVGVFIQGLSFALDGLLGTKTGEVASVLAEGFIAFAEAVGTTLDTVAAVVTDVLSGNTLKSTLEIAQQLANIPSNLNNIFKNFSESFTKIAEELPAVLENLINNLPKIAETLASKIGEVLTKIFDKLPQIVTSILSAFGSLLQTLFEKAIPALIDALPGVVAAIADALPGLLETILKALPNIITKIFDAIPKIIRSLVDAIPAIVEVFAENIGPIVEALVEGIIGAMGEIVAGLIDSLLVKGGLERIVGALIRAMPRIAVALVVGIAKGLGTAALAIGHAIGGGFLAIAENFKKTFAGTFDGIKQYFSNFGELIGNVFKNLGPQFAESVRGLLANIGGPFGDALRKVTEPFLKGLSGIKDSFQPLINAINAVKEAFEKASNSFGKGGGSGLISEGAQNIGDVLTGKKKVFSKGGMVYASDGYFKPIGTDTVPAMLTPGELVVPRDMVGQLGQFLDNNGGKSDAILMAILQAVQQPVTVQSEVKVNQSAFADIMLQLNRQNARVVA